MVAVPVSLLFKSLFILTCAVKHQDIKSAERQIRPTPSIEDFSPVMEEAAPLWGIISNPYALSLVIGANSLAIALSVLFSAGSYPQPISRSLHVFGVTKALIAAGFALIALRSELSPLWSVVAGNTLAMGGFAGNLAALWILQRKPVRYWFPVAVVLATLIGSWWFSFVTPDLRGLRVCTSVVTLFVIAVTADELLRRYKGGGRAHVLGGILAAITVFLMLLRIYSALTAEFQPGHHLASDWMERMFFCAAYVIATMSALNFTLISNDVFNVELRQAAASDPLTGLPNRRRLMERGAEEAKRALRYRRPLTVLVLDLDHFKLINDEYGHAVGDDALKKTAQSCRDALRDVDMLARLGGGGVRRRFDRNRVGGRGGGGRAAAPRRIGTALAAGSVLAFDRQHRCGGVAGKRRV
jgi:hypothetical protein